MHERREVGLYISRMYGPQAPASAMDAQASTQLRGKSLGHMLIPHKL